MVTKKHRKTTSRSLPPSHMDEYMVRIIHPSSEELVGLNRAEKYTLLNSNSTKCKNKIEAWIQAEGLETEVFKIEKPTAFNILFITCASEVAEQLKNSDVVLSVSRNPDIYMDLPNQSY